MEFNVLKNKKVIDGKLDLLSTFLFIDYDKIEIDDWVLVDEYSEMLLDLISYVKYGSSDYTDVLIKFNRIELSLEICKGDIIAIPNLDMFQRNSRYIEYDKSIRGLDKKFDFIKMNFISNNNSAKKTVVSSNYIKKSGNVII